MEFSEAIGKNLQKIRKSLGLNQVEVSSALGISRSAVSLIESGKRQVNSSELARLASLYHKTVSELLDPEPVSSPSGFEMLFRAREISKEDRIQIAEFEDLCKRYAELEKRVYGSVQWSVPLYRRPDSYSDAERLANDERRRLGLGTAPIRDVFSILENHGIRIFRLPLKSMLSGGFAYSEELGPCILINAYHGIRMVFTAAHEYFHCLVNRDAVATICEESNRKKRQSKRESIAEYFAACFLMPRESIERFCDRYVGQTEEVIAADIMQISYDFGVSYSAMLVRLNSLGLISRIEYGELKKIQPGKLAEEAGLPYRKFQHRSLPDKYVLMATKLYFQEKISIGKLAEYLKMSIGEAQGFVAKLREPRSAEELSKIA